MFNRASGENIKNSKISLNVNFRREYFDLFKIAFYRVITLMRNEEQLVEYKTGERCIFLHLLLVPIVQYGTNSIHIDIDAATIQSGKTRSR